jgi:L-malate glycosyltransferase
MRPRVLQLIDSFREGGSERQAVQLTRLLRESGRFSVGAACLSEEGPLLSTLQRQGLCEIPCFPLNNFYDRNAGRQLRRLADYLREQNIAVIHTHDFYTNIFGMAAATLARVPVRIASRRESSKRAAVKRSFERLAYRAAGRIIANCEQVRQQLIGEGVPTEKIVTIYNGVSADRVASASASREEALERLQLPDGDRRYVTAVANLREVKDHSTFLRAARRVKDAIPDAAFIIAGDGPLMDSTRKLASELGLQGDVFFLGRCELLAELLYVAEVCVLTSRSEGFSNSILEYMAAGRPVVATDVGGIREAFGDGDAGFLVSPGDDQLLAARVVSLLRDRERARAMGTRGKEIIQQRFSSEVQLQHVEKLYEQQLASSLERARVTDLECGDLSPLSPVTSEQHQKRRQVAALQSTGFIVDQAGEEARQ